MDKFKCKFCGWIGTENDMGSECVTSEEYHDVWSNWICPGCGNWYMKLEEWEKAPSPSASSPTE